VIRRGRHLDRDLAGCAPEVVDQVLAVAPWCRSLGSRWGQVSASVQPGSGALSARCHAIIDGMPLVWVTGSSGAGKSTVRIELRRRGYIAYDTDEDHLSRYFEKGSGAEVTYPAIAAQRTDEWFRRHTQRVPPETVRQIAAEVGDKLGFICGSTENENEIWDQFAVVIHLSVDSQTIRRRLAQRPRDAFGGTEEELGRILEWHAGTDASYERFGALRVDATKPVTKVVDDLLDACGEGRSG
jgi:shikimate kinase